MKKWEMVRLSNGRPNTKDERMSERIVYSVSEVAEMLGMSLNGCYIAIAAGNLPSVKIGKKIVVPVERLKAFLNGTGSVE